MVQSGVVEPKQGEDSVQRAALCWKPQPQQSGSSRVQVVWHESRSPSPVRKASLQSGMVGRNLGRMKRASTPKTANHGVSVQTGWYQQGRAA